MCILITIIFFALPAFSYKILPEEIPTHYSITGDPDSFAGKANIWFLAFLNLIMLLGFNRANALIKKEVQNKLNKRLLIKSLTLLKLSVLLLFLSLNTYTILIGLGVFNQLGVWFYLPMGSLFIFPLLPVIKNKLKS